ncbi:hypothetical protein QQF64_019298 [Cirrhinus molitorella]|uniref:Uncharacterized protein n=1 Tax=Cirrhinus molitorella TaxID=172907 RepID=A0ABR3LIL5_9TELE
MRACDRERGWSSERVLCQATTSIPECTGQPIIWLTQQQGENRFLNPVANKSAFIRPFCTEEIIHSQTKTNTYTFDFMVETL